MESPSSWVKENWSLLLAFPMIALGVYVLTTPGYIMTYCKFAGYCALIAFGLIMLVNPNKNTLHNVGFFALGMGISRVMTGIPFVFTPLGDIFTIDIFCIAQYYGVAVMGIGASLLYTGYMFFRGYARAYRRMIYTSSLIFVGTVIIAAVNIMMIDMSTPVEFIDQVVLGSGNIFTGILYGVLAVVLNSEQVRSHGYYETIINDLGLMGGTVNPDASLGIERGDAERLFNGYLTGNGWYQVYDGGPGESMLRMTLTNGKETGHLTALRVRDREGVRMTLSVTDEGSLLQANRFIAERIELKDNDLVMYCKGEFIVRFPLRGDSVGA